MKVTIRLDDSSTHHRTGTTIEHTAEVGSAHGNYMVSAVNAALYRIANDIAKQLTALHGEQTNPSYLTYVRPNEEEAEADWNINAVKSPFGPDGVVEIGDDDAAEAKKAAEKIEKLYTALEALQDEFARAHDEHAATVRRLEIRREKEVAGYIDLEKQLRAEINELKEEKAELVLMYGREKDSLSVYRTRERQLIDFLNTFDTDKLPASYPSEVMRSPVSYACAVMNTLLDALESSEEKFTKWASNLAKLRRLAVIAPNDLMRAAYGEAVELIETGFLNDYHTAIMSPTNPNKTEDGDTPTEV